MDEESEEEKQTNKKVIDKQVKIENEGSSKNKQGVRSINELKHNSLQQQGIKYTDDKRDDEKEEDIQENIKYVSVNGDDRYKLFI